MPVIPLVDLTVADKAAIREEAYVAAIAAAVNRGVNKKEKGIAVRELLMGDKGGTATDKKLIALDVRTAVTAGQEFWGQAAADLTSNALSSILDAEAEIPDDTVVVVYGFFDRTANPDALIMRFKRGAETLDIWGLEHCYVQQDEIGGLTEEPMIWEDDDSFEWEIAFEDGTVDKRVGLFGYVAERAGVNMSSVDRAARIDPGVLQERIDEYLGSRGR